MCLGLPRPKNTRKGCSKFYEPVSKIHEQNLTIRLWAGLHILSWGADFDVVLFECEWPLPLSIPTTIWITSPIFGMLLVLT